MPNTSLGFTYPAATDNVQLWTHIQALADSVNAYLLAQPKPSVKFKTATESVISNITPQNDDDLWLDLPVGLCSVDLLLVYAGASTADIRTCWTFSGTLTNSARTLIGPTTGSTDTFNTAVRLQSTSLAANAFFGVDGTVVAYAEERLDLVVSVAGRLQFQWAQSASVAINTSVTSASRLRYTPRVAG